MVGANEESNNFAFTHIITFIGVIALLIGVISFFYYAIANEWIGELGQVLIGIFVGLVLLISGIKLRKDKYIWSNTLIGASFFIFLLSIGVGVLSYMVLDSIVGLFLTFIFLGISIFYGIHFRSRLIVYFTIIGGILIPYITGFGNDSNFVLIYYIIFSLGVLLMSSKYSWADIRIVSYALIILFITSIYGSYIISDSYQINLLFLVLIFVLFNISSLIGVVRGEDKSLQIWDSMILMSLPLFILPQIYRLFDWKIELFGALTIFLGIIYIIELLILKDFKSDLHYSVSYILIGISTLLINYGIFLIINKVSIDFFMILFMIEYIMFALMNNNLEKGHIYGAFSKIMLILIAIWYLFVVRFDQGYYHALIFTVIMSVFVIFLLWIYFYQGKRASDGFKFVVSGFLLIYTIHKFSWWIFYNDIGMHVLLSVLWLIFSLIVYSNVETKENKKISILLVVGVLLKIGLKDLFYFEGIYRIIGFIIIGVILIVSGYIIKDDLEENFGKKN